jgi:hypothetical protein
MAANDYMYEAMRRRQKIAGDMVAPYDKVSVGSGFIGNVPSTNDMSTPMDQGLIGMDKQEELQRPEQTRQKYPTVKMDDKDYVPVDRTFNVETPSQVSTQANAGGFSAAPKGKELMKRPQTGPLKGMSLRELGQVGRGFKRWA